STLENSSLGNICLQCIDITKPKELRISSMSWTFLRSYTFGRIGEKVSTLELELTAKAKPSNHRSFTKLSNAINCCRLSERTKVFIAIPSYFELSKLSCKQNQFPPPLACDTTASIVSVLIYPRLPAN